MSDTTFIPGTVVASTWLNDINDYVYNGKAQQVITNPINVKDPTYGAIGNGTADDTAAIQAALNACSAAGGGVVTAPFGQYRITSKLTIPTQVKLQGATWLPDPSNLQQAHATSIYVDFGSGAAPGSGSHAVEMRLTSAIEGFTFFYPGQVAKTAATPTSFDYSISTPTAGGPHDNVSIRNITLFNSYAGINVSNGGRWRVSEIQGDPLFVGIKSDNCADGCFLNNVHFWNFYTQSALLETWVAANGTGFDIDRVDDLKATSLFVWNMNIAYNFGTNLWGSFTNITADLCNMPVKCTSVSQVQITNAVLISSALVKPAVWIVSGSNGIHISNSKITSAASVGVQIDGGSAVTLTGIDFANQHTAVVCTNTTTKVEINGCTYILPPYGTSNVKINGVPLPALSTAITLPAPTTNPTVIGGGYQFDLSTVGAKALQYDITTIAQRNSLYVLKFDYEIVGVPTTWNFEFVVDKDVGGQRQCTLGTTYPLIINGTPKTVYIPFFVNGCAFKTLLSIIATPTVVTVGGSIKVTNIVLTEANNASMSDVQVAAMIKNGYNQDFYGIGPSLMSKGLNRKVYPVLDAASGRATEVPTAGAWIVGDEMITLVPASAGFIGRVCKTAGTPGTWTTFGVIT